MKKIGPGAYDANVLILTSDYITRCNQICYRLCKSMLLVFGKELCYVELMRPFLKINSSRSQALVYEGEDL